MPETTLKQYTSTLWGIEQEAVRSFLILGETAAVLWDTGLFPCDMLALIRTVTTLPVTVINSHADMDHTENNHQFSTVYIHPADEAMLRNTRKDHACRILPAVEGEIFDLGNRRLEVVAVPGHTPGSICLLDRENRLLFSGDTVQRAAVYLFGDHRQIQLFPDALKKLQRMMPCFDEIYPSHGPCPMECDAIADLLDCYEAATAGELPAQNPPRPMPGNERVFMYEKNGCAVLLQAE